MDDRIAFTDTEAGLIVVPSDGGEGIVIDGYGYNPTSSPDGQHLIYMQDTGSTWWHLVMSRADGTGQPTTIVEHVEIPNAHSFPSAQGFSWQPVQADRPTP
ncbi:MAG: hypothetical protein M3R05_02165 [Chloroflexota bacterium]|nr:hypothetical protein [Chloroflexota bacterium]